MTEFSFTAGLARSFAAATLAVSTIVVGLPASAAIVDTGVCTYSTTVLSTNEADDPDYLDAGLSAATDCGNFASPMGGNTTATSLNTAIAFSQDNWVEEDEINFPTTEGTVLGFIVLKVKDDDVNEPLGGTWSLVDGASFTPGSFYAIALKGATASMTYLLDTSLTAGTWSMKDVGGNDPALSNMRLFSAVPLPAAAWLMLAGLGGLGLMSRRKAKAA